MAAVSSWPALLEQLLQGQSLSAEQATALMQAWLAEELEPVLTGALLAALRAKGVNGEELAAMALVLRQACPLPGARPDLPLVDTCGTGGDGANTFNISTAVAFVAAACGAHVAKHGNPSVNGKVGAAVVHGHDDAFDLHFWVSAAEADLFLDVNDFGQAFEAEPLALEWDEELVCGGESGGHEHAEGWRAVHEDEVVSGFVVERCEDFS